LKQSEREERGREEKEREEESKMKIRKSEIRLGPLNNVLSSLSKGYRGRYIFLEVVNCECE